jgi:hypothetical protein
MQLTKQQKIYAAVLLLAGVAFAVDRWVIGHGPEEAAAALPRKSRPLVAQSMPRGATQVPGAAGPVAAGPPPVAGAGTDGAARGPRSLAVRLQEVVKGERLNLSAVPDAFSPSRRWDPPDMLIPPPTVAPAPPPRSDLASQFKGRYKLNAVMKGRAGLAGVAIINGRMFVVGHRLDGWKLVAINEHSAKFEGPTTESGGALTVELAIETQGLQ